MLFVILFANTGEIVTIIGYGAQSGDMIGVGDPGMQLSGTVHVIYIHSYE